MQPEKSLNQLFNEQFFDDTSSNAFSDEDPLPSNENGPNPHARNPSLNNNPLSTLHLVQYAGLNYPDTASSEASLDDQEDAMRVNIRWSGRIRRSLSSQSLRINSRLIYKNYCKAMLHFNTQPLSEPYLREFLADHNVDIELFRTHVRRNENSIGGFDGLKAMLVVRHYDSDEQRAVKGAFKLGCEAFLKYFAVNWVFSANVRNAQSYLKQRFKLLRKIKDLTL